MWQSENNAVENYLDKSPTINSQSLIIAEWNLNFPDNIAKLGNYKYRPTLSSPTTSNYGVIAPTYDSNDSLNAYTGATDSDVVVDGGYDETDMPLTFISQKEKYKRMFSLESCVERFRPRSGINKMVYFPGKYINHVIPKMAQRPRYYMPGIDDKFKYWTSFRTDGTAITQTANITGISTSKEILASNTDILALGATTKITAQNDFVAGDVVTISNVNPSRYNGTYLVVSASSTSFKINADFGTSNYVSGGTAVAKKTIEEKRGIAKIHDGEYYIDDAAPFVVYKNQIPANRLVFKMQTNVGTLELPPFKNGQTGKQFNDPFYGDANKTVPKEWNVQYLDSSNTWQTLKSFTSANDIGPDGYVELAYGVINIPSDYDNNFLLVAEVSSASAIPETAPDGYAWLITDGTSAGTYRIFNQAKTEGYEDVLIEYGWYINDQVPTRKSIYASQLVDPKKFGTPGNYSYREFQYIKGIRIVVEKMNKNSSTFDLIEMSPRLAIDLSDRTKTFNIKKHASDLGESGLPVGQILSSTGEIEIFDYDQAFNPLNTNSIVSSLSSKNLQIKFYEEIIDGSEFVYFIPFKTMYADGFPETNESSRSVNIQLKDLFFYIESMSAPQLLIPDCSLSVAVSILLDSIGFSNYVFKRIKDDEEPIIPYFFVAPETTVSQVLEQLAMSTQTAMFFDEYNNLVLMSKEYMLPQENERSTDITLIGSETYVSSPSVWKNRVDVEGYDPETYAPSLSNISGISSQDEEVYNDGKIVYTTRYIQKETPSFNQALSLDSQKTWVYKPVLLWEVSPEQTTKAWNDEISTQSAYSLAAIPLATKLSSTLPTVSNGVVIDNVIDLGESVYWLSRYNGYFYANGEIIKFDAVEYNSPSLNFQCNISAKSGSTEITLIEPSNKKFEIGQRLLSVPSQTFAFENTNPIIIQSIKKDKDGFVSSFVVSEAATSTINTSVEIESPANYWVTNVQEYQKLFANLPFGGKIYPTGKVRIYSEPFYDETTATGLKEGAVAKHGRGQFGTTVVEHLEGLNLDNEWTKTSNIKNCYMESKYLFNGGTIPKTYTDTKSKAGVLSTSSTPSSSEIPQATANGIIKNILSNKPNKESDVNKLDKLVSGSIQTSALVFDGPAYPAKYTPSNFISYIPKTLDTNYVSYGTRMRIIGSMENSDSRSQTPNGSMSYYSLQNSNKSNTIVGGASGGLAFWLNPITNQGYYFEIAALTDNNVNSYSTSKVNNVFFYKVRASSDGTAIPIVLWSGFTNILVDDGNFTGQNRVSAEENPTVYDLTVEYEKVGNSYKFKLLLNGSVIASVIDKDPIAKRSTIAPFIRGSSRVMFENLFALTTNYSQNTSALTKAPVSSVFSQNAMSFSDTFAKYGMPGAIQSTYLNGISSKQNPEYLMYYEEFGTIMREMDYFNIRYDKAYPALFAKLTPTFNTLQGYAVSGFTANAYGAEFLVFNTTDSVLTLDDSTGNYLRIQGITFTQQSEHNLTVDDYFQKNSNLSDPQFGDNGKTINIDSKNLYLDIKQSRLTYGRKEFVIDAPYIQREDDAVSMMKWLTDKIMQPRKSVGLNIFSMPTLQLGDIIKINYSQNNSQQISSDSRFVVYSIEYTRNEDGPDMTVYLSEVK